MSGLPHDRLCLLTGDPAPQCRRGEGDDLRGHLSLHGLCAYRAGHCVGQSGIAGKETNGLAEQQGTSVQWLHPQSIRFSQASIKATFRDGTSIEDLAEGLQSGRIRPQDIPALRLFGRDGKLYTLDNRRLEAFRRAGIDVPVRMATPQEVTEEDWKFTTSNDGVSIRMRGG